MPALPAVRAQPADASEDKTPVTMIVRMMSPRELVSQRTHPPRGVIAALVRHGVAFVWPPARIF
jgi:hypothetical protein